MKKLSQLLSGKTCAVVGSSPSLLNFEYGKEIDEHDVIIRCNRAPFNGFETYVGSRTDIRIINNHLQLYFLDKNGYINRQKPHTYSEKWLEIPPEDLIHDEVILLQIPVVSPEHARKEFFNDCNEVYLTQKFSELYLNNILMTTGGIALNLADKFFSKITAYGFSFFRDKNDNSISSEVGKWSDNVHYWEKFFIQKEINSCHSIENEEKYLKNNKKITFK